jgi:hypothetical protein
MMFVHNTHRETILSYRTFGTDLFENLNAIGCETQLDFSNFADRGRASTLRFLYHGGTGNSMRILSEVCHLEPDSRNGRGFLKAIKRALDNFPGELSSG